MKKTLLTLLFGLIATIGFSQNSKTIALSKQVMRMAESKAADNLFTVNTGILETGGKMVMITEILYGSGQTMYRIMYDKNYAYSSEHSPAMPEFGLDADVDVIKVYEPRKENPTLSFRNWSHDGKFEGFDVDFTMPDVSVLLFKEADKQATAKAFYELSAIFEYAAKNGLVSKKTF